LKLTMGAGVMPAIITEAPASGPVAGKVAKYDRIMDVNGSGGAVEDIAKAIQDNTTLKITCRKPKEYKATLSPISDDAITRATEEMIALSLPPWVNIPKNKDWRDEKAVTPVKNQGACGSCYSFSTTGALEGACAIKTKKLLSFSEQQIMDCSWQFGNNGCNGGMFDRAFYYINVQGGIDSEASYPYTAKESKTCKYDAKNKAGQVSNFYYVKQEDEDALTAVLAMKGPVAIAINAGLRSFQFYSSGVYDDSACDATLNHGVLAVGYGTDSDSGKDYFLVKNSWGTQWGLDGYIKMRRNRDNQCGIATYPSIPEC